MTDLKTIKETRAAIKAARVVYVEPRFGTSETWVRISKADALFILRGMTGTPHANEMYTDRFGSVQDGAVYLG